MEQALAGTADITHIALIGNFLPRKCGLATFTTDIYTAMRGRFPDLAVDVYAMDDHPGLYAYPPEVTAAIPQDDLSSYIATARAIEASGAEAIWVQHEYGIYGGPAGEYLLALLDRTTLPVIVTLHTILEKPNADERRVMEGLLRRASRIIVMADRGRRHPSARLRRQSAPACDDPARRARSRSGRTRTTFKAKFGWEGRARSSSRSACSRPTRGSRRSSTRCPRSSSVIPTCCTSCSARPTRIWSRMRARSTATG